MIGYNEFGHPEFDTQRSALGELIYRLKYKGDVGSIPSIVETAAHFIREWAVSLDLIIPMPPSKQRLMQPVFEIASALGSTIGIAVDTKSVSKTSSTLQMKDIGDYSARVVALESTIEVGGDLNDKRVLLVDDLFQSGASMNVVARAIKDLGHARAVYAIALTRTRG
jgi:competence protein ComFC